MDGQQQTNEDNNIQAQSSGIQVVNNDTTVGNAHNSPNLEGAKKRAMDALVPIIRDLKDVSPERKFDICLSALRYTDDNDLVNVALDAALSIEEFGTKAEALVELVNEINYLLEQSSSQK